MEKEASYTNGQGLMQGTARATPLPGDAMEDWQILVNFGMTLGVPFNFSSAAQVRADIAARCAGVEGLAGVAGVTFGRPVEARNWFQSSNPSERWKWDFMYKDLPPVKGDLDESALPLPPGAVALREVK